MCRPTNVWSETSFFFVCVKRQHQNSIDSSNRTSTGPAVFHFAAYATPLSGIVDAEANAKKNVDFSSYLDKHFVEIWFTCVCRALSLTQSPATFSHSDSNTLFLIFIFFSFSKFSFQIFYLKNFDF